MPPFRTYSKKVVEDNQTIIIIIIFFFFLPKMQKLGHFFFHHLNKNFIQTKLLMVHIKWWICHLIPKNKNKQTNKQTNKKPFWIKHVD